VLALKEFSEASLSYYEITIMETTKDGAISVGVAHSQMRAVSMVGWEEQ